MNIFIVSSLGMLLIKALWTLLYIPFGEHMNSFLVGVYLAVKFLGHKVELYLASMAIAKQFSKLVALFFTTIRSI